MGPTSLIAVHVDPLGNLCKRSWKFLFTISFPKPMWKPRQTSLGRFKRTVVLVGQTLDVSVSLGNRVRTSFLPSTPAIPEALDLKP